MSGVTRWRSVGGLSTEEVNEMHPWPVRQHDPEGPFSLPRLMAMTDPLSLLAAQGCKFYSADADQNDLVTGQTSLAATTPTFLLDVPAGTTAYPLFLGLNQAGSVAGGDILFAVEIDKVKRYASGGTAEKVFNARTGSNRVNQCTLYSNPTAVAGYGIRTSGVQIAPDISPAEGAIYEFVWTPAGALDPLDGPASWLIFSYAASTGPSWLWSISWVEFPTLWLPSTGLVGV